MQATRVVNEQLSSLSGMDLVIWTSEQYGEPISYTNAQLANKFDLTVDGRGETVTNSSLIQPRGSTTCSTVVDCSVFAFNLCVLGSDLSASCEIDNAL